MSSSHRYHSASGPKVSPKCIQIHNNARRILIICFDHRSYRCRPVVSPLRLSMDRCCWQCSLWPMGYRVYSRLLVLFSYSVEVIRRICLFVLFKLNLTSLMSQVCDRTMAGSREKVYTGYSTILPLTSCFYVLERGILCPNITAKK